MNCEKCGCTLFEPHACNCSKREPLPVRPESAGSLPAKWRRLAESWIKATNGMDDFDDCRVRAVARANAYRDCADELEVNDLNHLQETLSKEIK